MSLLSDAIVHCDAIIAAAKLEIDGLTRAYDIVRDRPAIDVVDAIKKAIDNAAKLEDFSDLVQ